MKRLLLVNILSLIAFFGGCNFIGMDTSLSWKEEAQKLVSAFDNQDIKLAEKLFAKDVQKNVNLTVQLKKAFEFYNNCSWYGIIVRRCRRVKTAL